MNKICVIATVACQMAYCRFNSGRHSNEYFHNLNQIRIISFLYIIALLLIANRNKGNGKDKAFTIAGSTFCLVYGTYLCYIFLPPSIMGKIEIFQSPFYCACLALVISLVVSLFFKPKSLA
jgi:cytochrome bd-type quinol oxidase subunit 2